MEGRLEKDRHLSLGIIITLLYMDLSFHKVLSPPQKEKWKHSWEAGWAAYVSKKDFGENPQKTTYSKIKCLTQMSIFFHLNHPPPKNCVFETRN